MGIAKITAGDGYLYLLRSTAQGDTTPAERRAAHDQSQAQNHTQKPDATAYYTAPGTPPGRWTGRAAHLLDLDGKQVTEEDMRCLFGWGIHPNGRKMISDYIEQHHRPGMTEQQRENLRDQAIRHATLGRRFPLHQKLDKFDSRVNRRLALIRSETGRDPTPAEEGKIKAEESRRQRAAVAGFDLVFSPVKSAALLWALDERPEVREGVRTAHYRAVRKAMDLLEDHAAYTRTGSGGLAQIKTKGLIAAEFEHWDSRAGDPNLHTHVAVSSKVQGEDGKWRSLDARALYRMTVAASEYYNTAFEAEASALLGVTFTARPDTANGKEPVREITGIPPAMIAFHSRRRAAIEARYAQLLKDFRREHGHDPDPATCHSLARQANLLTRQGKEPPTTLAAKRAAWREEITARFGPGAVEQIMNAVPAQAPPQPQDTKINPDEYAERIVASTSARRSTWTIWNVRAETERVLRDACPSLSPDEHTKLAEELTALALSPKYSISVEAPSVLNEPSQLRRQDGESVFTEHAAERFTSQGVLDAEQRLLDASRTPTVNGLARPAVAAAIDGFEGITGTKLDPGQRALVTAFATDDRLLLAGIGPAGSGKTTAMRAYAHVLRQSGRHLVPLATSAAAADVLGKELSVSAENLHKFLYEWTKGPFAAKLRAGQSVPTPARPFRLRPGDVVLVDEAGMAGTFLLDKLVSIATAQGATVRLLGDDRQLSAVETGGAFRLVANQPGAPELTVLHRFQDREEGEQTLKIRSGDGSAVDWYHARGRIRSGSREAMAQAAYAAWQADMLAGKTTLMAAADGANVVELSAQARADRVRAGQVEEEGVTLADGNLAGEGDWIVTRHNNRRLSLFAGRDWVKNGNAWHVEKRHADGSLTVRGLEHGGRVTLPAEYVGTYVELMYATTAHRAQGDTVDTAHPLITAGMTREALYVLASRAREATTFYVATHDLPFDEDARVDKVRFDPRAYAAREVLLNVIATEGTALSATETITRKQEEAGSLSTLVPRYLYAAHQYAESRYVEAAHEVFGSSGGADLVSDPAWGTVVRRLYDAEVSGWKPAQLLTVAKDMRELETAESVAEVMSWRIDAITARRSAPSSEKEDAAKSPRSVRHDPVLPWLAAPPTTPSDGTSLPGYLADGLEAIDARVAELAARAARERPAWTGMLGPEPVDGPARDEWLRHLAIAAAYRDQHQIATDDPRQVLGPYPEPGRAGYKAYWDAAFSVLAARRAADLDRVGTGHRAPDLVMAQSAADIYRSLPKAERLEIANAVAAKAGPVWFGNRHEPDEEAVVQSAYAEHLVDELTTRKHITPPGATRVRRPVQEPLEAALAKRRRRPGSGRSSAHERAVQPDSASRQQDQQQFVGRPEPFQRPSGPVPGR